MGAVSEWPAQTVVMVMGGYSNDALLRHLAARQGDWADAGLRTVTTIGDAHAPSTIVWAVYSGHKLDRELDLTVDDPALSIRRESPCWRTITRPLGPGAEVRIAGPATHS